MEKMILTDKPRQYAQMGIQEYFAYDPNEPPMRRTAPRRLFGWHLAEGEVQALPPGADGRLWSNQLDSFLIPDGRMLRLSDREGFLRLTEAQAEAEARRAETEARIAVVRRAEALAEKLRSLGIDPDQI